MLGTDVRCIYGGGAAPLTVPSGTEGGVQRGISPYWQDRGACAVAAFLSNAKKTALSCFMAEVKTTAQVDALASVVSSHRLDGSTPGVPGVGCIAQQ